MDLEAEMLLDVELIGGFWNFDVFQKRHKKKKTNIQFNWNSLALIEECIIAYEKIVTRCSSQNQKVKSDWVHLAIEP